MPRLVPKCLSEGAWELIRGKKWKWDFVAIFACVVRQILTFYDIDLCEDFLFFLFISECFIINKGLEFPCVIEEEGYFFLSLEDYFNVVVFQAFFLVKWDKAINLLTGVNDALIYF